MSTNEPTLQVPVPYPDMLVIGQAVTARLPVEYNGADADLASATFSLISPTGTVVINAEAATVASGLATYAIGASDLTSYQQSHRWTEKWVLTITGVGVRTVRREAALVNFELWPALTATQLKAGEYPNLDDHLSGYSSTVQTFMDEAWREIIEHLFEHEDLAFHIVSSSALRKPLKHLTLWKVAAFIGREVNGANKWLTMAQEHQELYERAMASKTYLVDRGGDGVPDSDTRETASGNLVHPLAYRSRPITSGRF